MTQHPDEGTIHAWLDGQLDDAERAAVEEHVAACPECSALAAEARGLIAGASRVLGALDAVPGDVLPEVRQRQAPATAAQPAPAPVARRRRTWLTPTLAAAAAVAFLAVGSTLVTRQSRKETREAVVFAPMTQPGDVRREAATLPPAAAPDTTRVAATPPRIAGAAGAASNRAGLRVAHVQADSAPARAPADARAFGAASAEKAQAPSPRLAESMSATAGAVAQAPAADNVAAQRAAASASAPAPVEARRMEKVRDAERKTAQGIAAPAAAPSAALAPMAARPEAQGRFEGCYTIVSGDALGFPTRFVLDTTRIDTDAIGERYALHAPGQTAPGGASWIAMGPTARAMWRETVLELRAGGSETFSATMSRGEKTTTVTLKRCE